MTDSAYQITDLTYSYRKEFELKIAELTIPAATIFGITGANGSGKTTLLKKYLKDKTNYLFITGEDILIREFITSESIDKLKNFIGDKDLLVIDEAHH